jgi:hypothetical protein
MGEVIVPAEYSVAIASAEGEIEAILKKYNLRFTVIQVIIDGSPQPQEVRLVPQDGKITRT